MSNTRFVENARRLREIAEWVGGPDQEENWATEELHRIADELDNELPPPLPSGYYFGTIRHEPGMTVSASVIKAGRQETVLWGADVHELVDKALGFIWEKVQ